MNVAIFMQTVKTHYRSAVYVGVGFSIMSLMFAMLYEDMKSQMLEFSESMSGGGIEAFIGDLSLATSPEGWLSVELFALFFPIGLCILAIVYGVNVIGKEEKTGTLELLLASSVGRWRIGVQKVLALSFLVSMPAILLFLSIFLWSYLFNFDPDMSHVAMACISGWLLALVYGVLCFAIQAATGRNGLALIGAVATLGVTYMLQVVAKLLPDYKDIEVFSPFYYYDNPTVLIDGADAINLSGLLVVSLVLAVYGILLFLRRDTGV